MRPSGPATSLRPTRSATDAPRVRPPEAPDEAALAAAVETVVEAYRGVRSDALDFAEVAGTAAALARLVADGSDTPAEVEPRFRTVLGRRILELLRGAVIEHAVVLLEPGAAIRPEDIPFIDGDGAAPPQPVTTASLDVRVGDANLDGAYHEVRDRVLADFELTYLTHLVQRAGGNMSRAARLAGVDRTTLYRIMDKHGLQRETIMVEAD